VIAGRSARSALRTGRGPRPLGDREATGGDDGSRSPAPVPASRYGSGDASPNGLEELLDVPGDQVARIRRGAVVAGAAVQVVAAAVHGDEGVGTGAALEAVGAGPGDEPVGAGTADQLVGAGIAGEGVVAEAAFEAVGGGVATDGVVAGAADDVLDVGADVVLLAGLAVVGGTVESDLEVAPPAALGDEVGAGTADDAVGALTGQQLVVARAAVEQVVIAGGVTDRGDDDRRT